MTGLVLPLAAAAVDRSAASTVIFVTSLVLLISMLLLLVRALKGPTVFDRILAINALGTKTVILVACISFIDRARGTPGFFVDTAIVYALINFVATIAILKYIQYRRLG